MGCAVASQKRQASLKNTLALTQSNSNLMSRSIFIREDRRKANTLVSSSDFWGTSPFYVLKNRVKLLANEINNPTLSEGIFHSALTLLERILEGFDKDPPQGVQISGKEYKWIKNYEHGKDLLHAIGIHSDGTTVTPMRGVCKEHIQNKIKELSYAISKEVNLESLEKLPSSSKSQIIKANITRRLMRSGTTIV
jgi:hypothetical protein